MKVRPVRPEDAGLLLQWRNDPETRSASVQRAVVTAAEHARWFQQKLADPRCQILIGFVDGVPVGQVRFDLSDGEATIAIVVAPAERGRGHGASLLREGCRAVSASRFVARIRPENTASLRAFAKAGFVRRGVVEEGGVTLVEMVFDPPGPGVP